MLEIASKNTTSTGDNAFRDLTITLEIMMRSFENLFMKGYPTDFSNTYSQIIVFLTKLNQPQTKF